MLKLANLTDNELVERIKNKFDSESMEELINRHKDLFYSNVHKYHRKHPESSLDDLLDDLYIVFNRAVESYKPNKKTKFTTWLAYHSFWNSLNTNRNYGKSINMEHSDIDYLNQAQNKWNNFECSVQETNKYVMEILDKLDDKRIKEIFRLRYLVGGKGNKIASWKTIAPKLGISISYAILLHQRGIKFLNNKMKNRDNHE